MRLEDLQGRRLGRYQIVALLGRGGMAAVYRAHDTALRRDVALKVLYPQYSGDRTLTDRFEREAVLAASLDHPNIVPIYDVGDADGMVYIAMKLLGGQSLADVLRRRGALPLAAVAPIVEQIAAALDYAHARGIVHRDIKAGNIILEEGPGVRGQGPGDAISGSWSPIPDLHAVLTDFGIAKSLESQAPGLTGTGVLIGTPDYMAPEQIRSGQTVDYRVDIYALGVLVFRCLTGRLPFEGGTQQVLLGHLYGTVPDPSMLNPSLPVAVDPVVRKALARDPAERYGHAGDFARALRAAAGMEPATPPPARRRDIEGRAVIPNIAVDGLAQRRLAPDDTTRKGDAGPPNGPAVPVGRAPERGTPHRGAAAPIVLAVVLVLLVGGLLFAGTLGRRPSGGAGGAATHMPTVTEAPDQPTEPSPEGTPSTAEPSAAPIVAPTAAPIAAPTAAPATVAVVVPTEAPPLATTAPPPATATPAPKPTATTTPKPTATTTPEPTATTTPTPCPVPLTGGFGALWNANAPVRERIGCPIEAEQGGPSTIAEQPFERGSMFYYDRMPEKPIFVLIGIGGGSWRRFNESELINLPTPTPPAQPPCQAPLVRGFGLVWGSFPTIREALGCSTAPEDGLLEGAYQPFENGAMLFSQKGLGRGKTIYVLYSTGAFERYDDPSQ